MAQPRPVHAGTTYLVTRRCSQRTFRLRPHPLTERAYEYCLALACEKTGVRLHGVVVMSNHHHLVVTDERGVLPDFLRELHRSTAKVLNASQGQWENLWAAEQTSVVELGNDEDGVDKLAYVVANPVNAGLVERPDEWPGVLHWAAPGRLREKVAERPAVYFGRGSPERAVLRLEAPPLHWLSAERFHTLLARAIEAKVEEARRAVRAAGLRFLGASRVLSASFMKRARSHEAKRDINPRFAAKHGGTRRVLARVWRRFVRQYRRALEQWRAGHHEAAFPPGTWWMRVHHQARVAQAP